MKRLPIGVMVPTLVIGIMALFMVLPEFFISLKKPVDFNMLTNADLNMLATAESKNGLHVEGDVYLILDTFATEETYTENKDGSRTPPKVSGYYYIIPVGDGSYIGIEGSVDNRSDFVAIDDSTWAWLIDEAADLDPNAYYHYEGYIEKMDDELYQYFVEWFQDMEWFETTDAAQITPYALPLMIKPMSPGLMPLMIIGFAMIALNVLFVVLHMNYKKKAKAAKAAAVSSDEPWAPPASAGTTYSVPDAGYTPPPSTPASGDPWDAPDKQ